MTTFELTAAASLTAMIMWDPEATESSRYFLYVMPSLAAGFGMFALSHQQRWDTTIPSATHGAVWGGLDGFFIGTLIDGLSHERGMTIGPWAYGLAAVGTLAGGWLGATRSSRARRPRVGWPGPSAGPGSGSWSPRCPAACHDAVLAALAVLTPGTDRSFAFWPGSRPGPMYPCHTWRGPGRPAPRSCM